MALNLKFIKKWNALHISMNGKNNGKIMSDYYRFLDGIPEKVFPDNYSVLIPSTYLKDYLNKFEYCTTTNQTIKSMLGTEETIVPNITYKLKHLDKMKLQPYPFQEIGAQFLVGEKCGIIGDEVGLGSLTNYYNLFCRPSRKLLVIIRAELSGELLPFTDSEIGQSEPKATIKNVVRGNA